MPYQFKGVKQVLKDTYDKLSTAQKKGHIYFVRETSGSTGGDIYFGSRHYGHYNATELSSLKKEITDMLGTGVTSSNTVTSQLATITSNLNNKLATSTFNTYTASTKTALSGKAPNSHASSATTYGVGTNANYGHNKIISGDVSTITAVTNGNAAASFHNHDGKYAVKSHSHAISDVTNLQSVLDGKSNTGHTHTIAQVTNLQSTLDTKSNTGHTHASANITDSISAASGITTGATALVQGKAIASALAGKANSSHSHTSSQITDLSTTLSSYATQKWVEDKGYKTTDTATTEGGHYAPSTEDSEKTISAASKSIITKVALDSKNHVISAGTKTLTAGSNVSITDNGSAITIAATNTNTHKTSKNIVASAATATANTSTTNGSTYLNHTEDNAITSSHKIQGSGIVSVTADTSGNITIHAANTNTDSKTTESGHYAPSTVSSTYSGSGVSVIDKIGVDSKKHVTSAHTITISGGGATSVKADSDGNITISSTDSNTHQNSKNVVASAKTATANSSATNGNVWLNHLEDSSVKSSHNIKGSGATTVTSSSDGTIIISSTDNNTHHQAKNIVSNSATGQSNAAATNGNVRLNLVENSAVRSTNIIKGGGATTVTSDSAGTITVSSTNTTYKAGTGISIGSDNAINCTLDTSLYEVITDFPESPATNKIYLKQADTTGDSNTYVEYIYVNDKWEKLGEYKASVDLTPYLKKADAKNYIKLTGIATVTSSGDTGITYNIPNTNTDTHHQAKNVIGASGATGNSATSNGGTYLNLVENGTVRSTHKIVGSGATTVSTDANGNITISSTDHNDNTHYASSTVTTTGATATANTTTTNSNTYLNHVENGTVKSSHKIVGTGSAVVSAGTDGTITIYADKNTNTDTSTTESGHYLPSTEATGNSISAGSGKYFSKIKLDSKKHVVGYETGNLPTFTNTDSATTENGHYKPSATASTISAGSGKYVSGINVDSKNHVISVTTGTVPTNTDSATTESGHYTPSATASTIGGSGKYISSITLDSKKHVISAATATTPSDTHWTGNTVFTSSATGKTNAAATNGNAYLNFVENNTVRNAHNIKGANGVYVTTDTAGTMTISGTTYASTSHKHVANDVTGGTFNIARIPTGTSSTTVALGNHTHSNYLTSSSLSGYAKTSDLSNYLPLTGGSISGNVDISGADYLTLNDTSLMVNGGNIEFTNDGWVFIDKTAGDGGDIVFKIGENETQSIDERFAPISHTHAASAITSGIFAIGRIPTGTTSSTVARGDHNHDSKYLQLSGGTITGNLNIKSTAYFRPIAAAPTTYLTIDNNGIHPMSSGYFSVGTSSAAFNSAYIQNINATKVTATAGFFDTSDERLKNFGENISVDFEKISKLKKAYFTFKDDKEQKQHIGVSAQEVKEIYPELVSEDEKGYLSVDYAKLSVVALSAVDKLNNELTEIKAMLKEILSKK